MKDIPTRPRRRRFESFQSSNVKVLLLGMATCYSGHCSWSRFDTSANEGMSLTCIASRFENRVVRDGYCSSEDSELLEDSELPEDSKSLELTLSTG